jgi:hypothetical protein
MRSSASMRAVELSAANTAFRPTVANWRRCIDNEAGLIRQRERDIDPVPIAPALWRRKRRGARGLVRRLNAAVAV